MDEDRIIMESVREFGTRWSYIVKRMPGRTDNAIKNRYNSAMRRQKRLEKLHEAAARGEVEMPKPRARSVTGGCKRSAKRRREEEEKAVTEEGAGTPTLSPSPQEGMACAAAIPVLPCAAGTGCGAATGGEGGSILLGSATLLGTRVPPPSAALKPVPAAGSPRRAKAAKKTPVSALPSLMHPPLSSVPNLADAQGMVPSPLVPSPPSEERLAHLAAMLASNEQIGGGSVSNLGSNLHRDELVDLFAGGALPYYPAHALGQQSFGGLGHPMTLGEGEMGALAVPQPLP